MEVKKHIAKIVSFVLAFVLTAGHITGCTPGGTSRESTGDTESFSDMIAYVTEDTEDPPAETSETAPGTEYPQPPKTTENPPETTSPPETTDKATETSFTPPETTTKAPETTSPPETTSKAPETTSPPETTGKVPAPEPPGPFSVDELLAGMTLRQKVGQLFIVRPEALEKAAGNKASGVTKLSDDAAKALERYPVGGIAMFSANIVSPGQITAFNKALQNASYIPLFIAVDEEGGRVARLANNSAFGLPKYKSATAVGSSGNSADALSMGRTIGAYLKKYGFNMDFAPVADVNTNPANTVIGSRAFSSDAETAARMVKAMAEGLREEGIIPVFKHFPGHGDTFEDSHSSIAISRKTEEEMESCEWLTFKEAMSTDCIMIGHIAAPSITGDMTPASMSHTIVTEILRNKLGFDGLIITDSLEMGAITSDYSDAEAAVGAILAGCDIILMPSNFTKAFDAVLAAVENGTISEQRLDESVRRILTQKLDS